MLSDNELFDEYDMFEYDLDILEEGINEDNYINVVLKTPVEIKKGETFEFNDEDLYLHIPIENIEWNKSFYTEEEDEAIKQYIKNNKEELTKKIIKEFEKKYAWRTEEFLLNYFDAYYYAKGGKVKKMYALLVSPMGEIIADVEVERQDEREAKDKFRQMGITQTGSIRFSNTPPYYYQQGGELEEVLLDKIYDAEFGMYRIGDFFIIPDENENFPYHVTNREGAILYKAESLMDAVDWADSRYFEKGGIADSGQEIVVVAKDLDKDGGGRYKFRFLVYEEEADEAKKVAAALWEKSFSDLDLSVVEILTAQEWRKKYFKDGGLVSFDELAEATTETLKEAINKYQQQIDILNKIASPTVRDFAEFSGLSSQIAEIKKILRSRGETFKKGGKVKRVRFIDKVESISERLEGTKVPAKLKKDYGGRYSREEAEEAARRIAGAQLRDRKKMADGGMFPDVETFEQFKKKLPEIKNPFWGEEAVYKANFDSYSGTTKYFKGGRKNANSMSLADAYASFLYQTYKIDLKRLPEEEKKRLFGKDAKYYKLEDGGKMSDGFI